MHSRMFGRLTLCFTGTLLAGCAPVTTASDSEGQTLYEFRRNVCAGINNSFDCARNIEARLAGSSPANVRRDDDVLYFEIGSGATIRFENRDDIQYSYVGFLESPALHIIELQYYEGGAYVFVDNKSGHKTDSPGLPTPSPSGRRIVVTSVDLEAGYGPTVLAIWRAESYGLVLEYYHDLAGTQWGPSMPRWIDEYQVRFKIEGIWGVELGSGDLIRQDGVWSIVGIDHLAAPN